MFVCVTRAGAFGKCGRLWGVRVGVATLSGWSRGKGWQVRLRVVVLIKHTDIAHNFSLLFGEYSAVRTHGVLRVAFSSAFHSMWVTMNLRMVVRRRVSTDGNHVDGALLDRRGILLKMLPLAYSGGDTVLTTNNLNSSVIG